MRMEDADAKALENTVGKVFYDDWRPPRMRTVHKVVSYDGCEVAPSVDAVVLFNVGGDYGVGRVLQFTELGLLGREISEEELTLIALEYTEL